MSDDDDRAVEHMRAIADDVAAGRFAVTNENEARMMEAIVGLLEALLVAGDDVRFMADGIERMSEIGDRAFAKLAAAGEAALIEQWRAERDSVRDRARAASRAPRQKRKAPPRQLAEAVQRRWPHLRDEPFPTAWAFLQEHEHEIEALGFSAAFDDEAGLSIEGGTECSRDTFRRAWDRAKESAGQ